MSDSWPSLLSRWLAATKDTDIRLGLSPAEARVKADLLYGDIASGIQVDLPASDAEDWKDIAYALVDGLRARYSPGADSFRESQALYRYLARLDWSPDDFRERAALLRECASIGWRAAGVDIADLEAQRRVPGAGRAFPFYLALPGAGLRQRLGEPFKCVTEQSNPELPETVNDISSYAAFGHTLQALQNVRPQVVAENSTALYVWLAYRSGGGAVFDERELLLGSTAALAGGALRLLGKLDEADKWLDRALAAFAHTTEPSSMYLKVGCERLAIRYDRGQFQQVCQMAPRLIARARTSGMERDQIKCMLIEALAYKERGLTDGAAERLLLLSQEPYLEEEAVLKAVTLLNLGELLSEMGREEEAEGLLRSAWRAVEGSDEPIVRANLYGEVGQALRRQGQFAAAAVAYRYGVREYSSLGMARWSAYFQVLLAESLVAAGRDREAMSEIAAALPVVEAEQLARERIGISALLQHSHSRHEVDPILLKELREQIEGSLR